MTATGWKYRRDSAMPYQIWTEFPPEAIVQVKGKTGDTNITPAKSFWGVSNG
jgi:hypothetical protein